MRGTVQDNSAITDSAGRAGRRPMPQAASSKTMDGNARIRAEDYRLSFSIGCLQAICYTTPHPPEQLFVLLTARSPADRLTALISNDRPEALLARLQSHIAEQAQIILMPVCDSR